MIASFPSEMWLDPSWYNFWSSEWGGLVVKITGLIIVVVFGRWGMRKIHERFECDVEAPKNCHRWGHVVHGTGHRACTDHHPHAEPRGAITVEDIHRHHEATGASSSPPPSARPQTKVGSKGRKGAP